jgi:centrosomal protein CEP104
MDACCQYVKISLHKNYENKFNPFNQVGIVRIACQGHIASDYDAAMQANIPEENEVTRIEVSRSMKVDPIPTSKLDPMIQDKVLTLERQKEEAIVNENFDEAK